MELAFVMSPRQNHFFVDLVDAIRGELARLGVRSELARGGFPAPRRGLVYVLVPPHEYFALEGGAGWRPGPLLKRSSFICAEQPGSQWFDQNLALGRDAGALFDISPRAVREWTRRGIPAKHFPIGYTPLWESSGAHGPRDIDVGFLGSHSLRRARHLASYGSSLWRWRSHLRLADGGRPHAASGPDFLAGEDKRELLRRTRVLLNLHAGDVPYFESLRLVEAIQCGAVVVGEHSSDTSPLAPGVHFVSAQAENLMLVAQHLLEHETRRAEFADRALASLKAEVPLRAAVERLYAAAHQVDRSAPVPGARNGSAPPGGPEIRSSEADAEDPELSAVRRQLKRDRLELIGSRRREARLEAALRGGHPAEVVVAGSTPAYPNLAPRVSVVVSLFNYESRIAAALDSAASSDLPAFELIVVNDASTDRSLERALAWSEGHPETAAIIVDRRLNVGLPEARNTGVEFARADLVFILDADNELYPHCLSRLVEALDADPDAAFAYGMAERFDDRGPVGLLSVGGWDPERLARANYIDAMAMIRVTALRALGGYTDEIELYGWEDYDLWCKVAERGWRGVAVREILGRYRVSGDSMISATNVSTIDAYNTLIRRHPRLMAGIEPRA